MFVLDPIGLAHGQPAPVVYVARGQVAAAVFTEHELAERRAAADRARERDEGRARGRVADQAAAARAHRAQERRAVHGGRSVQLGRAQSRRAASRWRSTRRRRRSLISLDHRWIAELAVRHPPFEARLRRALSASRASGSRGSRGVKQELLDFFVRQGISVSGEMVRVRQLGLCIDCKLCEEACEERYGARRLTLGGYQLGMLDFIYTCRTCTDQRCIDPCAYDSIKYDEEKQGGRDQRGDVHRLHRVRAGCPYGAIDMVEVEPDAPTFKKDFKARLEKKDALKFGAGTGRVARARRIANKCDHCIAYGDQACVSACPTGSLIEINAYDLFRERSPAMAQLARTGFDADLDEEDRKRGAAGDAVHRGRRRPLGGLAKVKRGRYAPLADVDGRPARVPGRDRRGRCCASTRRRCRTSSAAQGAAASTPTSPDAAILEKVALPRRRPACRV